ncbi:hypothetical protein CGC20_2655 [Leishmania donovani]|uniref:Uncharacterized protein n=1 Tax=Leishmania donovani TaxID=5661 RepID=A0A504WXB3_LEIDO|nr:hypothetical protein CGC20_2655 [Leishmania donovani]
MEELAKSLQQAQAAVLGAQDELALLRAYVEEEAEGRGADNVAKAAAVGLETGVALDNPYYVDLHTSVHRRQEAASLLLQRCAHIFYEQFGALEEKAARLENVRVKEKELQSAKKSMQRYFDAHSKELAEERDRHDGALRLEWERRHHLEDGILRLKLERRQQRLAHSVLLMWMKKAMVRNLAREYTRRREAARETYQSATCDALVQRQRVTAARRALFTWRSRVQQRRCQRLKTAAAEAEQRAQFFRGELAATQQNLHARLNRDVGERDRIATAVATQEKECAQYEDEVLRLRTALRDMTVEFSERTRTYVRQQEAAEQLFARKEATLRDTVCSLQAALTTEQHAHAALAESSEHFLDHVNACWKAQLQEVAEAVRRKEEYAHHTILGLIGRLQHRHGSLRQEAAKLARDVDTLAPLSERCVRLENALAESEQLLKRSKASSQSWERRCKAAHVVEALLTDRVASAESAALRARSFIRWLGHSHTTSSEKSQRSICSLSDKMETQRRQLLVQQQEQSSRHHAEVAQLRDELEQLRRANVRLQSQLEAAARTQRERDGAYYDSEVRNGELSAAMLREKMERRGVEDKWWSSRASGLLLQEAQQRLYIEAHEGQWWTTLLTRESKVLKVWTASLHGDAAQLTAVCEGWQQHCHQIEAAHAAARLSASRREMMERHGKELARAHTSHDTALQRLQREHMQEKTQLQSIHQERCAALRRAQAKEVEQLAERHAQQLKIAQTAYAADVAQRDEQAGTMQAQLDHVGCLVVEYCAQATYSRWRAWAAERQAQRTARQRRGMIMRIWEWQTVRTTLIDACAAAKASLWASFTIEIAQERAVEVRRQVHYTELLLRTATEERRARRSTLVFTARMAEWRELAHGSLAEHQAAAMEAFADAAGKAVTEVSVARRDELAAYAAQAEEEDGAIAPPPEETGAEKTRTSDGDSALDVSGRAPGEREVDANNAEVTTGDGGGQRRSTGAMAMTPPLVQLVPEDLVPRLRSIESYVTATALALSSPHLTAAFSHQVGQADVPSTVRHLLELVRLAALRGAAAHRRDHAAELAVIQEKRAHSEEALASLRESMRGLLAEQRSLAGEMHADAQQQRQQYPTSREAGSAQASLASTESWQERLSALADRYTRALDAFYVDTTGREETFYSVSGVLVEADEFSERLLQRFSENASAMAQLRAQVLAHVPGIASAHQRGAGPDATLPADVAAAVRTVPPSSPEPKALSLPVTPPSSPGLPDNPMQAACSQRSSLGATTSAVGSTTSPAGSTPERHGLRDRVRFLERLLVETKVQLAEAKSLVGVAHRAASLSKASAEAQVWAAQDAEDFSQLALSKEHLLVLYAASESTTRTLMTAMREYDTQLRGTQAEMSQQLRTACAAVEEALQARHRVDVERYEAKVRALSDSLAAAAREQSRAEARYGELEQQLKSEAASWAEKYSRDTQLIRQSCLSEIDELAGHQRLLEDELQQCRRATQSSIQRAVERQTELLRLEHTEKLRRSERNVARLATEKALLEGRLRSVEEDCERQVQQERAAVARLQHGLAGDAGAAAEMACVATLASFEMHLFGATELYARCATEKAAWLTACVAGLMEQEREQWETEVMQLRERVAFLLEASGADPAAPARDGSFHQGSRNVQESGRTTSPQDKAENSSQALTVSPSPRRSNQGVSSGEGGASIAAWGITAQSSPRRAVSSPSAAKTSRGTQGTMSLASHDTTPTRCRSLSVDSLELSQSFLRYSKMLSDQRSRNATRLERANALAAEVDDLLLRGAQLGHSAASQSAR